MNTRTLPTLPGCGRAASARIEAYSPAGGRMHGQLDASLYFCEEHAGPAVAALQAAGMVGYRLPVGQAARARCGGGYDFLTGRALTAPEPPVAEPTHPAWCDLALCTPTGAGRTHMCAPVQVEAGTWAQMFQYEDTPARIEVAQWHPQGHPGDVPINPADPDEVVFLTVASAGLLARVLAGLVDQAKASGGAR